VATIDRQVVGYALAFHTETRAEVDLNRRHSRTARPGCCGRAPEACPRAAPAPRIQDGFLKRPARKQGGYSALSKARVPAGPPRQRIITKMEGRPGECGSRAEGRLNHG
jgi:hypothetical protein